MLCAVYAGDWPTLILTREYNHPALRWFWLQRLQKLPLLLNNNNKLTGGAARGNKAFKLGKQNGRLALSCSAVGLKISFSDSLYCNPLTVWGFITQGRMLFPTQSTIHPRSNVGQSCFLYYMVYLFMNKSTSSKLICKWLSAAKKLLFLWYKVLSIYLSIYLIVQLFGASSAGDELEFLRPNVYRNVARQLNITVASESIVSDAFLAVAADIFSTGGSFAPWLVRVMKNKQNKTFYCSQS